MFGAQPVHKVAQDRFGRKLVSDDPLTAFKAQYALPPQTVNYPPFVGVGTVINASSNNGLLMVRQPNCSITAANVPYNNPFSNDPYNAPVSETANVERMLHNAAGLTASPDNFDGKCPDPTLGIASTGVVYAGATTTGMRVSAFANYNPSVGNNTLTTIVMDSNGTFVSSTPQTLPSTYIPYGVSAADLNGDGNPDLVVVGSALSTNQSPGASYISVLLGKADGTFKVGTTYQLPGQFLSDTLVIDDFNGDGRLDVVVPAGGFEITSAGNLNFLPGNGDGTFGTPKTLALTATAESLVSGDFNGDGKKDLASGRGQIFLGNGDGTFQPTSTPLFTRLNTNSNAGPQLAVGDFNKDGKLDIAAGTGVSVYIYLGNGDGTFTAGNVYAGINNRGGLAATDIDGDGNVDLFSGFADRGIFGGDDFIANEGYALMGRGDGTFVGAPQIAYAVFNGLEDLNGDGKLDFVGLTNLTQQGGGESFTTFYGHGDGTFAATGAPLPATTYTYQGTQYTFGDVDSYAIADLNGDGHPDIVYLPGGTYSGTNPQRPGYLTALGNADGSHQAPVFTPAPDYVPGQTNYVTALGGLWGVTNQNGKFEIIYSYQAQYIDSSNTVIYNLGYATQLSNGDGTFAAPVVTVAQTRTPASSSILPPAIVGILDLNNDKIPDLVTYVPAVYGSGGVVTTPATYQVSLGNADGTFQAPASLSVIPNPGSPASNAGQNIYSIAFGDVNGDGIPDIVAEGSVPSSAGAFSNFGIGVALGKGDGTFTVKAPILLGGVSSSDAIAVGDFTGDGKGDLAVLSFDPTINGIFPGNGDGTFQSVPNPNAAGNGTVLPAQTIPLTVGVGLSGAFNLNGDGKIALLAGNTFFVRSSVSTAASTSATALTASASSVVVGQSVTFTATVSVSSGSGTPTGTITFLDGTTSIGTGTLNGAGVTTLTSTTLTVGTHSITASYAGDVNFSGSTSSAVSIEVNAQPPAASTTTLTASATAISAGQSVTLTATIAGPSGNATIPTGIVTFLKGTTNLGSGTLKSSGTATLSTTTLPVGADSITAMYGGDANFSSSTSSAVTVTVTAPPPPDFSIMLSATSATVSKGGSTTTTVSVAPMGGFNQAVSFACSGLPSGATCSFSPQAVTPNGTGTATTSLTIATAATTAALQPTHSAPRNSRAVVAWGLILFGMSGIFSQRRKLRATGCMLCLLTSALVTGCGSSHHSTTSTITITAMAGTITQSTTFSLTVK